MVLKKPSDPHEYIQQLAEHNAEIIALYRSLGYSHFLDRQASTLLAQLKDLLAYEIADFRAFRGAVAALEDRVRRFEEGDTSEGPQATPQLKGSLYEEILRKHGVDPLYLASRELFDRVVQAGDDCEAVLSALRESALHESLPFELHQYILVRAKDDRAFERLLTEIKKIYAELWRPISEDGKARVLECFGEVEAALREGCSSFALDTALKSLWMIVTDSGAFLVSDEAWDRKGVLKEVLWNSVCAELRYKAPEPEFRDTVRRAAKLYADNPWMRTPWLTTRLVTQLLDAELGPLLGIVNWPSKHFWAPVLTACVLAVASYFWRVPIFAWFVIIPLVGINSWQWIRASARASRLGSIRAEISGGDYYGEEVARHLREFERGGYHVSTIIYQLLKEPETSRGGAKEKAA
jgi:hypothetical protein